MTTSIWETVANTPWWVFVLFTYLVIVGYLASRPRIVPIKKLVILPTLFIALSCFNIYKVFTLTNEHIVIWLGMLVIGFGLGWLQFKKLNIKAIKEQAAIMIPGTWTLLLIIVLIFSLRYYYGYQLALNPNIFNDPKTANILLSAYGLTAGLFSGRLAFAWRCLKVGPYVKTQQ